MSTKSKCSQCSMTEFEVVNETPVNSNYALIFVRCANCHTVIGVVDYYNVGTLLKKLANKLDVDLDL